MKNLLLILFICFCSSVFGKQNITVLSLKDAIKIRTIKAVFNYTRKGKEHKRVLVSARNNTTKPVKVCIPSGTYFRSENVGWQDHIVTQNDTFLIKPKKIAQRALSAFCCESSDGAPQLGSSFYLEENPNKASILLCKLIDSLDDHTYSAQRAIWQLFDRRSPNRIVGRDAKTVMALRKFVGAQLNMPVQQYRSAVYIKQVPASIPVAFHNEGVFKLKSIDTKDKIEMQLYSTETDELIGSILHKRMLVQEKTLCLFMHDIKLPSLESDEDYIVRISKNGVVQEEWLYESSSS